MGLPGCRSCSGTANRSGEQGNASLTGTGASVALPCRARSQAGACCPAWPCANERARSGFLQDFPQNSDVVQARMSGLIRHLV